MIEILNQLGLSPDEALVYEYLLKGPTTAGDIIRHTNIKRGTAYNVLGDLVAKGFVHEDNTGKIAKFALEHPSKIIDIFKEKQERLAESAKSAEALVPSLASRWNLAYHKPTVRYFEGPEGTKAIMEDTLQSEGTIRSFVDIEAVVSNEELSKINEKYLKKRIEAKKEKLIISPESKLAKKRASETPSPYTQRRFIPKRDIGFETVVNIYDNKVSYITLSQTNTIGVIIENPSIYKTQKLIFDHLWEKAESPEINSSSEQKENKTSYLDSEPEDGSNTA